MTTINPGAVIGEAHPAGKLASTLLSVSMAGRCEVARFRRGKVYLLDGAVQRLDVTAGTLTGTVQGTQSSPYRALVTVKTHPRPAGLSPATFRHAVNSLMPQARDIDSSCTCADWESPCKHAVATVLAFARELVVRPELLLEWRCGSADPSNRPRIGARAERPDVSSTRPTDTTPSRPLIRPIQRRQPPPAPWESDDWFEFVGDPDIVARALVVLPSEPVRLGRSLVGSVDLVALVRSAQAAIRGD